MTALTHYDAARRELAAAHRVDEVKKIRDKAAAMAAYAKLAKDDELVRYAVDIKERAEVRAGELLREMKERGERDSGKGNRNPSLKSQAVIPKLSDLGVTPMQSSRWMRKADEANGREITPVPRKHPAALKREEFLHNAGACLKLADYDGRIDATVVRAARAVETAWCKLADKLEKEINNA